MPTTFDDFWSVPLHMTPALISLFFTGLRSDLALIHHHIYFIDDASPIGTREVSVGFFAPFFIGSLRCLITNGVYIS